MRHLLIDDWRNWWRRWSTWLAAAAGAGVTVVLSDPSMLLGIVAFLPEHHRLPAALGVGLAVWIVPVIIAHLKQRNLEKSDANPE